MVTPLNTTWTKVGALEGKPVWRHADGRLAVERDFEVLCELSPAERRRWLAQQPRPQAAVRAD